jgi:hypothetical protein
VSGNFVKVNNVACILHFTPSMSYAKQDYLAQSEWNLFYTWIDEILQHSLELLGVKESLNARFQIEAQGYITNLALR